MSGTNFAMHLVPEAGGSSGINIDFKLLSLFQENITGMQINHLLLNFPIHYSRPSDLVTGTSLGELATAGIIYFIAMEETTLEEKCV